jgi:hypothetical protein
MDDDELERLAKRIEQRAKASMAAEAEAIGATELPGVDIPEGHVVLFGFEGNVDAIVPWRDPLPDVLKMSIERRLRISDAVDDTVPALPPGCDLPAHR